MQLHRAAENDHSKLTFAATTFNEAIVCPCACISDGLGNTAEHVWFVILEAEVLAQWRELNTKSIHPGIYGRGDTSAVLRRGITCDEVLVQHLCGLEQCCNHFLGIQS